MCGGIPKTHLGKIGADFHNVVNLLGNGTQIISSRFIQMLYLIIIS